MFSLGDLASAVRSQTFARLLSQGLTFIQLGLQRFEPGIKAKGGRQLAFAGMFATPKPISIATVRTHCWTCGSRGCVIQAPELTGVIMSNLF